MKFYGYHGLLPEENKLGQRFSVDLELYANLQKAGESDKMGDSINYAEVYLAVKEVVEGSPKKLIETVADDIAKKLFESFPTLRASRIRLTKPDAPIPGHIDSVAVEIFRETDV